MLFKKPNLNIFLCAVLCFYSFSADAASGSKVSFSFTSKLNDKMTLVAISKTGVTKTTTVAKNKSAASLNISSPSQFFLRTSSGSLVAITTPKCNSNGKSCSASKILTYFKKGSFTVSGLKTISTNPVLTATTTASAYSTNVDSNISYIKSTFKKSILAHGQKVAGSSSVALVGIRATLVDADGDGLPDSIDSDNDGDGVIDNYDKGASDSSAAGSFKIFSNFKSNIESSINKHSTGLSSSAIDTLMSSIQTLAIEVKGSSADTSELDCGSLGYCSSGGTGKLVNTTTSFPGSSGGTYDADADGYGTLTKGATGDFQLQTGATTSTIKSGDTLLQYVTSGSTTTSYTGVLNFIFSSNPALKNIIVSGGATQTINYSANPILGSSNNCIQIPVSTDPVTITMTGWRPQRPGNTTAGEAEYVDIGNSLVTIDIPNQPCTLGGGGGCTGQGPGNCRSASYSTTDANLSTDPNGLQDKKGDVDADSSNTYTFNINLTDCLNNASGGAISWSSGQTLFVDLQFRSNYGDNAAQKVCFTKQ